MAKKSAPKSGGRTVGSVGEDGTPSADPVDDFGSIEHWIEEIESAKRTHGPYWDRVDAITKKYKAADDDSADSRKKDRRYNVLWSIVQTMQPLVYSQPPQPYVSRRHSDRDPVGRDASMVLERTITYELEGHELHDALSEARDDYLLGSRGVIWPKYTPYMVMREVEGASVEEKVHEEVCWEHVPYRHFLHGAGAKWRHLPWVARMVPMTRRDLVKRFKDSEIAKKVPLTIDAKKANRISDQTGDTAKGLFAKAEVWEVWCKVDRKTRWICPQYSKGFLEVRDDFLELDGYFPCPKPMFGTKTNDTLLPTPDYMMWQDIAIELDDVTLRIKLLTESLRVVGVCDATVHDTLKRLTTQTRENDIIPVNSWAMFAERGGLKNAIEWMPLDQIAAVLDKLYMVRERLLSELYDITGVSDIVRGASDPRETAKAQQIKGNFATKRLGIRQDEALRMAEEALSIQAEIICKHYSVETIKAASSAEQALTNPETSAFDGQRFGLAMMLLKNNPLRRFRVRVNERTLASADINDDQEQRVRIVEGISQLVGTSTSLLQIAPAAGQLLGEVLMFALRGFPLARTTEASVESALEHLLSAPMAPQQGGEAASQGPTPDELAISAQKNQIEYERMTHDYDIKKRELDLRERELALREREIMLQAQNRDREAAARESKSAADAMIKAEQVRAQHKQADGQIAAASRKDQLDMVRWVEEMRAKEATDHHDMAMAERDATREDDRAAADAQKPAPGTKSQARSAFAR